LKCFIAFFPDFPTSLQARFKKEVLHSIFSLEKWASLKCGNKLIVFHHESQMIEHKPSGIKT